MTSLLKKEEMTPRLGGSTENTPKLKKRKEKHEALVVEEKEPTKKTKQDERDFFF